MYLGIDLGTTNSVVSRSFVDRNNNLVTEVVNIGQLDQDNWDKLPSLPSMVYFSDEGRIVGREAKRQRYQDREHVVTNAKRFMGTKHKWTIDGESFDAKEIGAIVLQHCKKSIDREGNMKYDTVVITVPASFNPDQISDTIQAAKIAGFEDVIIKHEPTAALLSFIDEEALKQPKDRIIDFSTSKRILVFDLGGGTCDTSVIDVKVDDDGIIFTERGVGRYQELGGIDFDAKLATGLMNNFFQQAGIMAGDLTDYQKDEMYRKLLLGAETIKEKISSRIANADPSVDVETISAKHIIPDFYDHKPLKLVLTKKDYDEYTKDLYIDKNIHFKKFEDMEKNKNIITVIRKTLEDYDISPSSIDYIFMTGGMSKFLTVRQKVEAYLNKPIIMPQNPMDAVARGASIYQHYKVTDMTDRSGSKNMEKKSDNADGEVSRKDGITDHMMLAEAILLDVNEGLPKIIIPRKTFVPYEGEIIGEFRTSSPSGIKLNIYAAEDEFDSSMRLQKSLEKAFRFPVRSGTPFDIKYKINENKAISMKIVIDDGIHSDEMDLSVYSDFRIEERDLKVVTEDDI